MEVLRPRRVVPMLLGCLVLAVAGANAHAAGTGLVAAYSFDESTGTTVADASRGHLRRPCDPPLPQRRAGRLAHERGVDRHVERPAPDRREQHLGRVVQRRARRRARLLPRAHGRGGPDRQPDARQRRRSHAAAAGRHDAAHRTDRSRVISRNGSGAVGRNAAASFTTAPYGSTVHTSAVSSSKGSHSSRSCSGVSARRSSTST
jgi:hypothetical protein